MDKKKLRIFVTICPDMPWTQYAGPKAGKRYQIDDWMYWFEEQGVTDINDTHGHYRFEAFVDDVKVWESDEPLFGKVFEDFKK